MKYQTSILDHFKTKPPPPPHTTSSPYTENNNTNKNCLYDSEDEVILVGGEGATGKNAGSKLKQTLICSFSTKPRVHPCANNTLRSVMTYSPNPIQNPIYNQEECQKGGNSIATFGIKESMIHDDSMKVTGNLVSKTFNQGIQRREMSDVNRKPTKSTVEITGINGITRIGKGITKSKKGMNTFLNFLRNESLLVPASSKQHRCFHQYICRKQYENLHERNVALNLPITSYSNLFAEQNYYFYPRMMQDVPHDHISSICLLSNCPTSSAVDSTPQGSLLCIASSNGNVKILDYQRFILQRPLVLKDTCEVDIQRDGHCNSNANHDREWITTPQSRKCEIHKFNTSRNNLTKATWISPSHREIISTSYATQRYLLLTNVVSNKEDKAMCTSEVLDFVTISSHQTNSVTYTAICGCRNGHLQILDVRDRLDGPVAQLFPQSISIRKSSRDIDNNQFKNKPTQKSNTSNNIPSNTTSVLKGLAPTFSNRKKKKKQFSLHVLGKSSSAGSSTCSFHNDYNDNASIVRPSVPLHRGDHSFHPFGSIHSIQSNPFDDKLIVTGTESGNVVLWDIRYGAKEVKSFHIPSLINDLESRLERDLSFLNQTIAPLKMKTIQESAFVTRMPSNYFITSKTVLDNNSDESLTVIEDDNSWNMLGNSNMVSQATTLNYYSHQNETFNHNNAFQAIHNVMFNQNDATKVAFTMENGTVGYLDLLHNRVSKVCRVQGLNRKRGTQSCNDDWLIRYRRPCFLNALSPQTSFICVPSQSHDGFIVLDWTNELDEIYREAFDYRTRKLQIQYSADCIDKTMIVSRPETVTSASCCFQYEPNGDIICGHGGNFTTVLSSSIID